jgi:PAS domain S-box-containing protein
MEDSISAAIIESMSDGLFVLDFQGYFTHINRAALNILGIEREQVYGNTYVQLFMDFPENDEFNDILFDGIQNRETRLYREVTFKKMDGTYLDLAVTTSFLRGTPQQGDQTGIVIVFKDVTETKALERARYRVIHHLSHELKTPLSIISTSLKTIESTQKIKTHERIRRNLKRLQNIQLEVEDIVTRRSVPQSGKILPRLEQILDLIELMAQAEPGYAKALNLLKQRIRTFFEIDPAKIQEVDLGHLIMRVADLAKQRSAHRPINLSTTLQADICLRTAADAIEKAVMGLVKNAIENTPDGGDVQISLRREGGKVIVEVKDTGIGITTESRNQIFGGFYVAQDTELYATKQPFEFGAGGKALDLLRIKIFGEIYNFQVDCETSRCRYIPLETDLCPGKIPDCRHIQSKAGCAQSGGSIFRLTFLQPSESRDRDGA